MRSGDYSTPEAQEARLCQLEQRKVDNLITKYKKTGKPIYKIILAHDYGLGDWMEGDEDQFNQTQ